MVPSNSATAEPLQYDILGHITAKDISVEERPHYQAYQILRVVFTIIPVVAGVDKYFNVLADWANYLAPLALTTTGLNSELLIRGIGVIEVVAGIAVLAKPRIGSYIVAAWLFAIMANLVLLGGYYDIILRDFGLALGAIALGRLAKTFDQLTVHHISRVPMDRATPLARNLSLEGPF